MRVFFLVLLGLATSPLYADQPTYFSPPADFNWAGTYVGAYVGNSWATANMATNAGSVTSSSYFSHPEDIASINQSGTNSLNPNSQIIGIQFGDNVFTSHFITAGWVVDYGSFPLSQTNAANNIAYTGANTGSSYSLQTSIATHWLSTTRALIGFTPPTSRPLMLYATGGLALASVTVSNNFSDTTSSKGEGSSSRSSNQVGWALGTGIELPVAQHFTLNVEYLYVDLGTVTTNGSVQNTVGGLPPTTSTSPLATSATLYANLFKLDLNYKF